MAPAWLIPVSPAADEYCTACFQAVQYSRTGGQPWAALAGTGVLAAGARALAGTAAAAGAGA